MGSSVRLAGMAHILLAVLFSLSRLSAADPLDLATAIKRTLCENTALKQASLEIDAVNAQGWQDCLYPNPLLTVELDSFGGHHDNCGFNSAELYYSITQLILLGGKRDALSQLNAAQSCISEWDYAIAKQNLISDLIHAFIAAFVAQEKLALAEEKLKVAQETHLCVAGKLEAGKTTLLQEKREALAVQACALRAEKAKTAFKTAKLDLAAFWEEGCLGFEQLQFPLFKLEPPPPFEELEIALTDSPELGKAVETVRAGLAAITVEEAMAVPDLEVTAGVGGPCDFRDHDFFVSFAIPLPIFNCNQGNRARACSQSWQAAYARQGIEVKLRSRLKRQHQILVDSYNSAKTALELEQELAKEAVQSAEEALRQGKIEKTEWLESRKTWLETRVEALEAAAEYQLQKVDTEHLTGQLLRDRI